jgi:hypothetical protein
MRQARPTKKDEKFTSIPVLPYEGASIFEEYYLVHRPPKVFLKNTSSFVVLLPILQFSVQFSRQQEGHDPDSKGHQRQLFKTSG